mmetsp:Transcript_35431/g.77699  ORF Transcript_35431/g.77699 Transcript_35431/m.77699 type:complete len:142 (-) Transcript_35431:493-918(-)
MHRHLSGQQSTFSRPPTESMSPRASVCVLLAVAVCVGSSAAADDGVADVISREERASRRNRARERRNRLRHGPGRNLGADISLEYDSYSGGGVSYDYGNVTVPSAVNSTKPITAPTDTSASGEQSNNLNATDTVTFVPASF